MHERSLTGGNRGISRRSAMKAGVAAAAAPFILPGSALGLGGRLAPSERLNIGLIGCGNIAGLHRRTLLGRGDVQLVAVSDVKAEQRAAFKQQIEQHYAEADGFKDYEGCDSYHEFEALLERPDVDAVVIATPDHWHAILAVRAIEAGKDVYCQKPLTLTVSEARIVADRARARGTVFQTGSQQRSDPSFRKAAEIVRNGWIGKIQRVEARLGEFPPERMLPEQTVPEGLDYERWLGPAPWAGYHPFRVKGVYDGGWRIFRDYSGRKNTDWGAHHFDIIQWALGMDEAGPVEFLPPGEDGVSHQTHRYANGTEVQRRDPDRGMIKFIGSEGTVWVARGGFLETDPPGLKRRQPGARDVRLYRSNGHHADWLEAIRRRADPICPAEVGARSATVCHLCNIARWVGRPIEWDPVNETIPGDEEARRWLERPYRAPWRL